MLNVNAEIRYSSPCSAHLGAQSLATQVCHPSFPTRPIHLRSRRWSTHFTHPHASHCHFPCVRKLDFFVNMTYSTIFSEQPRFNWPPLDAHNPARAHHLHVPPTRDKRLRFPPPSAPRCVHHPRSRPNHRHARCGLGRKAEHEQLERERRV